MSTATVSLYCPPMKIAKVNGELRRTAAEPMTATIVLDDGTKYTIPDVTIPPTLVRKCGLLSWEVDPCVGQDASEIVVVKLPSEPVHFELEYLTMVAEAINAPLTFTLPSGDVWEGSVRFPDAPFNLLTQEAEAVTATGTLTKQDVSTNS